MILSIILLSSIITSCESKKNIELALIISEKSTFQDDGFNQSAWEGIKKYCDENNVLYEYYVPEVSFEKNIEKVIDTVVKDGAKTLVLAGSLLGNIVYKAQDEYPDIRFILIDSVPNNGGSGDNYDEKISENTHCILFAEEQAGFLAGYAAVHDGYKNLGFFGGMSIPPVVRFGYGFIQGAEFAANELELEKDSIEIKYLYCGNFNASPENQAKASMWYHNGTEIIFACGGAAGRSVISASEGAEKWVIGVDVDQSSESATVVTSALKMISGSVYNTLEACYEGEFPGGKSEYLGADKDGIGLAINTSRFRTFSSEDYDKIYDTLKTDKDGITSNIIKDDKSINEIPTYCVNIIAENMRK